MKYFLISIIPLFLYIILDTIKGLHMLQQNWYNLGGRYVKWLNNNSKKIFLSYDYLYIFIFLLSLVLKNNILMYIVFFYYLIITIILNNEQKKEIVKTVKKNSVKKSKKKDNSLVQVISPYYGNFEEKEETDSEAVLTAVEDSKDFQDETNTDAEKTIEPEIVEEEKLPTVEDNLRNIAKIVEEEQDQLKIIEERTGEFKLDFGQKKSEEQNSLIDEIDDNMSLDELMSLYEKKFKD